MDIELGSFILKWLQLQENELNELNKLYWV